MSKLMPDPHYPGDFAPGCIAYDSGFLIGYGGRPEANPYEEGGHYAPLDNDDGTLASLWETGRKQGVAMQGQPHPLVSA